MAVSSCRSVGRWLTALVCVAALTACAADATPSDSGLVHYGEEPLPSADAQRPADVQDLAQRAAELVDWHKGDFLGSYVTDGNVVVVVPSTAEGEQMAQSKLADSSAELQVLDPVVVSVSSAQELGEQLRSQSPELEKAVMGWGASPATGGMELILNAEPSPAARQAIAAFAAKHQVPIEVYVEVGASGGFN